MSLSDGFSSQVEQPNTVSFSPAEGFVAIALLACAVDGQASDHELRTVYAVLERMQLFKGYSSDALKSTIARLAEMLKSEGFTIFLATAVRAIPLELHDTAFAIAADIVLTDGVFTEEEEYLLDKLHKALEVDKDTAKIIASVILIKNRG
ncbi:MAG TPA: tellurite resistance TerB family protein [Leptolyngbyaceae cyanobacterium M33_DOE_097]|nr:tellurite resistance TerB family protein [Leptolyngbyaceae cyanobacterium M33_DOE_097]